MPRVGMAVLFSSFNFNFLRNRHTISIVPVPFYVPVYNYFFLILHGIMWHQDYLFFPSLGTNFLAGPGYPSRPEVGWWHPILCLIHSQVTFEGRSGLQLQRSWPDPLCFQSLSCEWVPSHWTDLRDRSPGPELGHWSSHSHISKCLCFFWANITSRCKQPFASFTPEWGQNSTETTHHQIGQMERTLTE